MYHIIVNPASKSGRGLSIWNEVEPVLRAKSVPYRVIFSKGVGHVTQIVKRLTAPLALSPDAPVIRLILLGGDGTVNEALQGISRFDKVFLGYIPTGSSNDLARDLRLPKKPLDILDRILACEEPRAADIGILTYLKKSDSLSRYDRKDIPDTRIFSVSAGIGFDAAVCEEALSSRFKNVLNKLGLGKLTYMAIALRQILTAKPVSCDLYLDGGEPIHLDRFLFVTEMIHRYEGGGFKFCPDADWQDGMFDLCVVGSIPKLLVILALPTAFWGKHYFFPSITSYRAKTVRLDTSAPLWVHTDGEVYLKSDSIYLCCEPQKLLLMM